MIRAGLIEPPKPKIKLGNMMRVLGNDQNSDAIQDPTKIEQRIREEMAERQQAHGEKKTTDGGQSRSDTHSLMH